MNVTIKQLVTLHPSTREKRYSVALWIDGKQTKVIPANGSHDAAVIAGQLRQQYPNSVMAWG